MKQFDALMNAVTACEEEAMKITRIRLDDLNLRYQKYRTEWLAQATN